MVSIFMASRKYAPIKSKFMSMQSAVFLSADQFRRIIQIKELPVTKVGTVSREDMEIGIDAETLKNNKNQKDFFSGLVHSCIRT